MTDFLDISELEDYQEYYIRTTIANLYEKGINGSFEYWQEKLNQCCNKVNEYFDDPSKDVSFIYKDEIINTWLNYALDQTEKGIIRRDILMNLIKLHGYINFY